MNVVHSMLLENNLSTSNNCQSYLVDKLTKILLITSANLNHEGSKETQWRKSIMLDWWTLWAHEQETHQSRPSMGSSPWPD